MRWLYHVPFMTYGFRTLMELEFAGSELNISGEMKGTDQIVPLPGNTLRTLPGNILLKGFEIVGVEPEIDILILVVWLLCMHLVSIIYLFWSKRRARRTFVYSD